MEVTDTNDYCCVMVIIVLNLKIFAGDIRWLWFLFLDKGY